MDCILSGPVEWLFLVDNSLDDRLRELGRISERVKYIHSVNRGYGAGHNIAIREAMDMGAKYHVVVNPDIWFETGVLERLLEYMDAREDVSLVMPQVVYPDGEMQYLCKLLPSPVDLLGRRFFPWKRWIERRNQKYELRFADYHREMEVPSLSGCFMFMRIEAVRKVGGFDERYFMYAEDLDLCRRLGHVGRTLYYPGVSVCHAYEKGSYKNRKLMRYHICAVVKYFNKWGWFFDSERCRVNKHILRMLKENQQVNKG